MNTLWDAFKKDEYDIPESIVNSRMDACRSCEHFIKLTSQCKRCGCVMPLKTKLRSSMCPEQKWLPYND